MPAITPEVRDLVQRTRLGFVATVNADGSPNLSPKGTVRLWDDDQLIFADLESPGTIRNLRRDPRVEVNVVDPILRKGFRFRGRGRVVTSGPELERAVAFYVMGPEEVRSEAGSAIRTVVIVEVEEVRPLVSPGYRGGITEETMRRHWLDHYSKGADPRRTPTPAGIAGGILSFLLFVAGTMYVAFDPGISLGGEGFGNATIVGAMLVIVICVVALLVRAVIRAGRPGPARPGRPPYTDRWSV
jgi:predicted pyridoxine 5'-phosphate oxidase superfamily flavin-nucleotide-binding protein